MKKSISVLLAILLIALSIPFTAGAASSGTCGDNLTWVLDNNGTLTISGSGDMYDFYDDHAPWYNSRYAIKKVIIKNGVTSIGMVAFFDCKNLADFSIADSVINIGMRAFYGTAYYNDNSNWDNGVLYVGNYLVDTNIFYVNGSYKIKAGTKYITHAAFSSCYGLTEVIIPGSVVEIGVGGFQYCDFLENVTISNGVKSIGGSAFEGCPRLTSITIPDSVTSIDDNAFDYCDSLESIIIPESVTYIGEDVFQESNNVTIYGYRGSAAQRYAETNNIPFVSLDVITRVAGGSRVDTSLEVASRGWTRANTVILTNGYNFADALAGGPLSYALNAPILLTANKEILEQSVINKINALGATKVIILGGTAAVNSTIEQTLSARYNVERVYGASRFDTAVAIAEKLAQVSGRYSASAFVAYGYNYPDALAVSSAAAISGTPILFAKADGSFTESTANYISGHRIRNATILGGTGAVGAEAEYNLARLGAANVERVFGASRYDTAFAIVRKYANLFTGNDIVLATGASFPDALAGGAFAAKIKAPVILVHPKQIADGALEYIAAKDPETVYVLGGTGAVADSTAAKFISLLD